MYEVHMASAALMVNGEIITAAHEERFSRIKLDVGFPLQAAQFCLQEAGIRPEAVDVVALSNVGFDPNGLANILFKRPALYKIQDWIDENDRYWRPKLVEGKQNGSYFHAMGGFDRVQEHYYDIHDIDMDAPPDEVTRKFNEIRKDTVERLLGIPRGRVVFLPHYMLHHYHAYYSSHMRGKDVVITHMEGDGGGCNAAVSITTDQGLKQIGGTNQCDLGRLYQWCTLLLGMKPYHHEFKIMGLAPYATEHEVNKSIKIFEQIFRLDEDCMSVIYNERPRDLYFSFRDRFIGHRFDGIAGALQTLLENHLTQWIEFIVNKTGRPRVCFGGGVAMNVKANMLLSQLPCVNDLFVPLSPGDETNVFGAGYQITEEHFVKTGRHPDEIPPITTLYPGPCFSRLDALKAIDEGSVKEKGFFVTEHVSNEKTAELLAEGFVIGRLHGKSEFGQRALGNRSILANPSMPGVVDKINHQIKYRDFWMPFCPSVLDTDAPKYIDNPKNIRAEFMTIGFPARPEYKDELKGGLHSGDLTARPQVLDRKRNPEYYDLIVAFKKITRIGALINTSFNLHGEPIVNTPADALHTFFNSELDAVWMEDILVSRKKLI